MSNIEGEQNFKLPLDLPRCACFDRSDPLRAMARCSDVGGVSSALCDAFHQCVGHLDLCKHALPYAVDVLLICVLAYVAKAEGPALEYGSVEIEREALRILGEMTARLPARIAETYARGRELGLTEANVRAMREEGTRQ